MTNTVHFTVGPLLGEHLLEIAQTNISNGNIEYGSTIYEKAFGKGFTNDLMLKVLKNELVVVTDEDGTGIHLMDDPTLIKENIRNIFDWTNIIDRKYNELNDTLNAIKDVKCDFNIHCKFAKIDNVSLKSIVEKHFGTENVPYIGVHNLAAKLIAGENFPTSLLSNGSDTWEHLCLNVEDDNANNYEYCLYYIVKYVNLIRELHKDFIDFEKTYRWLVEHDFISRISMIESHVENILEELYNFANPNTGYYHPMCDEKLYDYKDKLMDDIQKSVWGNEYAKYGILKKNILDGYDAGYLSPEGDFYGDNGPTGNMIHLNLAEQLFKKKLNVEMEKDGVTEFGSKFPERWLDENGWVKIHHNEIYGAFIGDLTPTEHFKYKYCPTTEQVNEIIKYADKYYKGKFYTCPQIIKSTDPISTYKLRQMDKFKLHEVFSR